MKLSEYDTHCPTCDAPEPWHAATCAVVHVNVGEPSDAQVLAALSAYMPLTATPTLDDYHPSRVEAMRAALRAAVARSLTAYQQISDAEERLRLGGGA